jgi:hypothetical protein
METFSYMMDYPLGAGLGRWGQMNHYFGDRNAPIERGPIWVEIQPTAWVIDGGAPLFLGYLGAIIAAMASTLRIALRGADPEVADWAAVVFAMNLGTLAACFAGPSFMGPGGVQFWLLAAVIHGANERARLARATGMKWS